MTRKSLSDLQMPFGGDARERRREALDELRALANEQGNRPFDPSPDELIRQDRSR